MKVNILHLLAVCMIALGTGPHCDGADAGANKTATFTPVSDIDAIGFKHASPSGKSDSALRITGVNPEKAVAKVVIKAESQSWLWTSGPEQSTYVLLQYYKHDDFLKGRKSPLSNAKNETHKGLSDIDILFEPATAEPAGIEFVCEVAYEDGSKNEWKFSTQPMKAQESDRRKFGHAEKLLVSPENAKREASWKPQDIMGRSFWNIMEPIWGEKILLKGKWIDMKNAELTSLPVKKGSTVRLDSGACFLPLSERNGGAERLKGIVPYLSKICVREMQVFDESGADISKNAIVYGQCDGGGFDHLGRVNDGDTSADKPCSSNYPIIDNKQTGWLSLDFQEPVSVSKMILHHGGKNGPSPAYVAKDFNLQSWDGKKWADIPETKTTGNTAEKTEHSFAAVKASKFRLVVENQNGLYDYAKYPFSVESPFLGKERADEVPKDKPFIWWYLGHDPSSHFQWPKNPVVDMAGYAKWKERHPNFMGFQLVEMDNDMARHFLSWNPNYCVTIDGAQHAKNYVARSKICVMEKEVPPRPATREEAVNQMRDIFQYYKKIMFGELAGFLSLTIWHHYTFEWGGNMTFLENGGGGQPPLPMQIAAARGAARQYGKPWGMYQATFEGNGYTDNMVPREKAGAYFRGPECGKSASLYRRQLFLALLSGINFLDYEHQREVHFKPVEGKEGEFELSRQGRAMADVFELSEKTDIGVPLAPVAIAMDYNHGWRHDENAKVFMGVLPPTDGDRMIDAYMRTIFPWDPVSREGYGHFMGSSKYGDIFDIVVVNPPSGPIALDAASNYKAMILVGNIAIDEKTARRLEEYVSQGGTLVMNATQANQLTTEKLTGLRLKDKTIQGKKAFASADKQPIGSEDIPYACQAVELTTATPIITGEDGIPLATRNKFGKGLLVMTLQRHMTEDKKPSSENKASGVPQKKALPTIDYILDLLSHETMPLRVDGPVEHIVNKTKSGWLVSLVNNKGVFKEGSLPPVVKQEKTAQVKVTIPGKLKSVEELTAGAKPVESQSKDSTELSLSIPPGELRVLKLDI